MVIKDEINSRKRIIVRYLKGEAELKEWATTASSVLQLVDQIEGLARIEQFRKDTDERVQSIKKAHIETIEKAKALLDGMLKEVD